MQNPIFPAKDRIDLPLRKTAHFVQRQQARRITDTLVAWALTFGQRFYEGEDRVFFLGHRQLDRLQRVLRITLSPDDHRHAEGVVVIIHQDGTLVTAYRNPEYCRVLRRRER